MFLADLIDSTSQTQESSSQQSPRGLILFIVLFVIFISVFSIAYSWYSWLSVKDREKNYLSSITELGGKSLNGYFSAYESGLSLLQQRILEKGWPINMDHTTRLIKQYHQVHHELMNITLYRADGQLLASSIDVDGRLPQNKQVSFYSSAAQLVEQDFVIGQAAKGELSNKWGIPMRYAIRGPDGQLVYILNATIDLSRQQNFWENIFLPENAGMGLLRDDLHMQSRFPIPEGDNLEKTYSAPRSGLVATYMQVNNFPQRAKGEGFNNVTGFTSLFSLHRLKDYPLTLFVNIPVDGVMEKWVKQTQSFFILVTILVVSTFLTAYIVHKRRYAIAEERKLTDALIRQSEERFNLAMQGTNDGLWDWNLETDEVYYSPRWKSMLGYRENEIEHTLNEGLSKVHPDDQERVMQAVKDYIEGESSKLEMEMRMLNKQGGWVSILSRAFVIRREIDNRPVRLIGTHVDITERHRANFREKLRNEVLEKLSRRESVNDILKLILDSVGQEGSGIKCTVMLLDEKNNQLNCCASLNLSGNYVENFRSVDIGIGMGGEAACVFTRKRVLIDDIQSHPYCSVCNELATKESLGACYAEPVLSLSGSVLGAVSILHQEAGVATETDLYLLELMSMLTAVVVEQGRANEDLQQASLVYKNSHEAMVVTDAVGIMVSVNPAFVKLTGYSQDELIGNSHSILKSGHHDDEFYKAFYTELNKAGHWQGEFWNRHKNGNIYIEWVTITAIYNSDGSVHRYVCLSADITEKKESEELIWRHANFDTLTGLPNRRMFRDQLEREITKVTRSGTSIALMFVDLDRFKEVNDSMGHAMGDSLLKEVAKRITENVRKIDMVARLGGDEFTVVLSDIKDPVSVERICQNILQSLAQPIYLGGGVVYVSGSIGITFYPKDAENVEDLLRNADHAMYAAKNQGRNRNCYFTTTMQLAASQRTHLMNDLRGALEDNQFEIYYQPIVNLETGKVSKAEALLRWQHPTRGLIGPNEFIHLTEETGLINSIGDWLFHEVANQASRWREEYGVDIQVSINKSPVQFQQKLHSSSAWVKYLKRFEIPGKRIAVEITEGLLLDASEDVTQQLLAFRDAGIQVSLDDFGTGYSSLAYLKKFDIDFLKIDRAFIKNISADSDDLVLCEAIVVMAHKLGIKVVAEGVETRQQLDLVIEAGSDYAQGYYFSKPLVLEQFEAEFLLDKADKSWV